MIKLSGVHCRTVNLPVSKVTFSIINMTSFPKMSLTCLLMTSQISFILFLVQYSCIQCKNRRYQILEHYNPGSKYLAGVIYQLNSERVQLLSNYYGYIPVEQCKSPLIARLNKIHQTMKAQVNKSWFEITYNHCCICLNRREAPNF